LLFDYPAPAELAAHLRTVMSADDVAAPSSALAELDKLERMLSAITVEEEESARITARLGGRHVEMERSPAANG